jgi:hypothetical protein
VVDCAVDTADGWVIIDHKVLRGAEPPAQAALAFAGQLGAYAAVLEQATGKPVLARYIHLPLSGCVVGLEDGAPPAPPGAPSRS